jgi:PAS domain S-box-containing protein
LKKAPSKKSGQKTVPFQGQKIPKKRISIRASRDSEEKFRSLSQFLTSILESATRYAIMAMDVDGTITEFNKGAENLFGWSKEEVIRKQNIGVTFFPEIIKNEIVKVLLHRI